MHRIEIVGTGCPRCKQAYRVVKQVIDEERLDAEVIEVDSMPKVLALGILSEPGILVDGELVLAGRAPHPEEVREFLGVPVAAIY